MPNGRPYDNPLSDTLVHGLHPFPPDIEQLVLQVHHRDPTLLRSLMWAPFDWEKGHHLEAARVLLRGLLDVDGTPESRAALLAAYEAAVERSGGRI